MPAQQKEIAALYNRPVFNTGFYDIEKHCLSRGQDNELYFRNQHIILKEK